MLLEESFHQLHTMMLLEEIAESERNRPESGHLTSTISPTVSFHSGKTAAGSNCLKAKRWDHHLSVESLARNKSTLKATSTSTSPDRTISLGVARPHSQYYPWEAIDIHSLTTNVRADGVDLKPATLTSCVKGDGAFDLAMALNYGASAGSPQLLRFIIEHVSQTHDPPYADWDCSLTCGTTSGLEMVFRMLCNRGDHILAEEFTYAGAMEVAKPLGLDVVGIEMDSDGLLSEQLESVLTGWDSTKGPRPRVLYTIPTAQNPTGTTQPPARRKAIYQIAERFDLIIVEDDPYYLLPLASNPSGFQTSKEARIPGNDIPERLLPSYVSLDTSGRVIRLDTASKILAPGLRIGWITACSQLIEKFLNHTEFSTTSPSGSSQIMMHKLLVETWGHAGFVNWLTYLSSQYTRRLDIVMRACTSHLPSELCRWNMPSFGMFVWIEVDWTKHPLAEWGNVTEQAKTSFSQIEERIYQSSKRNGVQISRGSWFAAMKQLKPRMHFRITFAAAPQEQDLEEAVSRLGRAVREEFYCQVGSEDGQDRCDSSE